MPNLLGPPEKQDGSQSISSECHGGWSQVTDESAVRQMSDQWVDISKIDPQQEPQQEQEEEEEEEQQQQQQQQQQRRALVDLGHVAGKILHPRCGY